MKLNIYSDGGARNNPGPSAIGILICDEQHNELLRHNDFIGSGTNNIAEYCALIAALEIAGSYNPSEVHSFLDSELVVRQLTGQYKVKDEKMKTLYNAVKQSEQACGRVTYHHVLRTHEKIKIVDSLVNQRLDEVAQTNPPA